ncbi:MAG: methylmalonyl-CoA mutase family protein [Flavitalea sp.]
MTMEQAYVTAEEINRYFHYFLSQGIKDLSLSFDLPTQLGHDSDHNFSEGKVGKGGVAIDSVEDMQILFNGISLDQVHVSITSSATDFILPALFVALAKQQGVDLKKLNCTIQNDPVEEKYIYPQKASARITNDTIEWCMKVLPNWKTNSVSEFNIRKEDSAKMPENSFTLSNVDDSFRILQTTKLEELKRKRNPAKVDMLLQILNDCAAGDDNIIPAILEAVENYVTLGEIADTLREVYGEYK